MTVRIVSGISESAMSVLKLNTSIILKIVTMKTLVKLSEILMFYYLIYCARESSCAV